MKNTHNKKKPGKDSVNRKSSIIFMQLGLIFALVLTYIAIESKTINKDDGMQASFASVYDMDEEIIPDTTPEPPKEEPKKQNPNLNQYLMIQKLSKMIQMKRKQL